MNKISAFMDGETGRLEARQVMRNLKQDDQCCELWETFHLIGDVLRGESAPRADFSARLHARMEHEPTLLAPRITWRKSGQMALYGVASVSAVAVVLTLVFADNPFNAPTQIAAVPPPSQNLVPLVPPTALPQPVAAVNKARVNEYLMAHQGYSPSTMLQGVAPYIRTVSAAQDGGGR